MKNESVSLRCPRARLALVAATIICIHIVPICRAGWTRGLPIGEVGVDEMKPPRSFVLRVWGGDDEGRVHGYCVYFNLGSTPVRIEGVETDAGEFYPVLLNGVADSEEAPTCARIQPPDMPPGKVAVRLIQPKAVSEPLKVNLDAFRGFLGKQKWGRLSLKTGETAVFQIDDLQPPDKRTEKSADAVQIVK